jgi:molecular chaperone GrpE
METASKDNNDSENVHKLDANSSEDGSNEQTEHPLEADADTVENPSAENSNDHELETLREKISILEKELDKSKDHMLRVLADTENTKKRIVREKEDATKYAVSSFAKDLLDFSDNFGRALASIPEELIESDERISNLFSGLEAMQKELLNTFEKHGITQLDPLDQKFDPNFHEVMFETPSPDKIAGTIIQVLEPGYTLHGRLIRPARVGIAKDTGQDTNDSEPGSQVDQQA